MKRIKSFIYLDNYKMYSISSQIFEGLTEYIIKSKETSASEKDEQKGKIGSGRIMADIIESNQSLEEKKFLHDYSYNLFEEALLSQERVLTINQNNFEIEISKIEKFSFIKVTGKVVFNDTKLLENLMDKYNDVGLALTLVTEQAEVLEAQEQAQESIKNIKDKNQKAKAQFALKKISDYEALAKKKGLRLDKDYLNKLKYLINFGYNEQFQLLLPLHSDEKMILFSSIMKRELFTESETNVIKNYSRETEKEFTVFGILTQTQPKSNKINILKKGADESDKNALKEALLNLTTTFTDVERTFHGKLSYEYLIDPIAVYREL